MAEIIEFKNDLHCFNLPTQYGTISIYYDGCFLGDDDGKYYFHIKGHASGWIHDTFEYHGGLNDWIGKYGFNELRRVYKL